VSLGLSPASRANEVIGNVFFENRSSDVVNDIDPKDNSQAHSGRLVAAYIINDLKTGNDPFRTFTTTESISKSSTVL